MSYRPVYQYLADFVLVLHVSFVLFVLVGLILVLAGGVLRWRWVRHLWFRTLHVVAIAIVVVQAWLGHICPVTSLEMWLRERAGDLHYEGSFIQYWLQRVLYYNAPDWVFVLVYTLFGLLVVASWWWVRPSRRPGAAE